MQAKRRESCKKEKTYAEGAEDTEFAKKKEKPKTQAHTEAVKKPR